MQIKLSKALLIKELKHILTSCIKQSSITVILLEDISRFENRDGSIYIDFGTGFTGNIWAVAKRAGLQRVAQAA